MHRLCALGRQQLRPVWQIASGLNPSCLRGRTRALGVCPSRARPLAEQPEPTPRLQQNSQLQPEAIYPEDAHSLKRMDVLSESPITDAFGRYHDYLRISLTERCNLRCTYCMPEDGVQLTPDQELLSTDEIVKVADLFVSAGVTKIRFTGGEPLVRKDLPEIISRIGELRAKGLSSIAMTTNGVTLPRKLDALASAGLNHINISLDTLDPLKFELITRRRGHDRVLKAIQQASTHPEVQSVKVNCVVTRGVNDREIVDFVELSKDLDVEIRFIEYMPFDGNKWQRAKMVSYAEMLDIISMQYGKDFHKIENHPNDTSKTWKVTGYKGRVGFVTSMSEHFCFSCNRLRLTADGNLKVCLFGASEVSLRDSIREGKSDTELLDVINGAVKRKKARHAGMFEIAKTKNRPMITIGELPRRSSHSRARTPQRPFRNHRPTAASDRYMFAVGAMMVPRQARCLSSEVPGASLSHVDESQQPTMVDISDKRVTARTATAESIVELPDELTAVLDQQGEIQSKKGPVTTTAIIAGTMAVKRTSDLIPFCHPLPIDQCKIKVDTVTVESGRTAFRIRCTVKVQHKTGVEMEALVGASMTALTIYDMCKAVSHDIIIRETKLVRKTGGKSDIGAAAFNKQP